MAEYTNREHYIPLRHSDLIELLCTDLGAERERAQSLRQFNALLSATFHYEYYRLLDELKNEYAPFDPDAATLPIKQYTPDERTRRLDDLHKRFVFLMERANFKRLTLDEVKEATKEVTEWGLNMDVDFSLFERLDVFIRGDALGTRYIKRWWQLWSKTALQIPSYQRVVLFVKMKPSKRLPEEVDTEDVFLKIFKDIPKLDLEMLLPGARMQMPFFHRAKLGGSLVGSGAWLLYSMIGQLWELASTFGVTMVFGPLTALLGFGYKQWYGYQNTKTVFSLRLTQSLYYQTLGTNLSVLFHLLDEAEEQECREALLAYYYLWRYAGDKGWDAKSLDDYVEMDLERLANLKVDFEIDDALGKLERLQLVTKVADRYVAVPMAQALAAMDHAWDNYFKYNTR